MTIRENTTPVKQKHHRSIRRKTLFERVKAFYAFLEQNKRPIYISELKTIGMDTHSVKAWLKIFQFIHTKPSLIIQTSGKYTTLKLDEK